MKLNEISSPLHLLPKFGNSSKKFDSKFQFQGFLQGQHGVPKKKSADGKTYFIRGDKVVAIWDGMLNTGTVYTGDKSEA